jgi:hypothetical protein
MIRFARTGPIPGGCSGSTWVIALSACWQGRPRSHWPPLALVFGSPWPRMYMDGDVPAGEPDDCPPAPRGLARGQHVCSGFVHLVAPCSAVSDELNHALHGLKKSEAIPVGADDSEHGERPSRCGSGSMRTAARNACCTSDSMRGKRPSDPMSLESAPTLHHHRDEPIRASSVAYTSWPSGRMHFPANTASASASTPGAIL